MKDAHARKALYIEAINEKRHDTNLLAELQAENNDLKAEIQKLKPSVVPAVVAPKKTKGPKREI